MNWIILFLAGLFEVSLILLGKNERGIRYWFLSVGKRFLGFHGIEYGITCQSGSDFAFGHGIRHLDGYRSGRHGLDWDIRFQRAGHSHTAFLPVHAHCLLDWIESCVILKRGINDEI